MARPAHRRGESLQLQRLGSASARLARICSALRNCVRLLVQCLQVQRWSERQATACGVRSLSAERSLTARVDLCSCKVWPRSGRCRWRSAMMEWQASAADNEESLQLQRLCGGATRPLVASFGHRSALVRSAVLLQKSGACGSAYVPGSAVSAAGLRTTASELNLCSCKDRATDAPLVGICRRPGFMVSGARYLCRGKDC